MEIIDYAIAVLKTVPIWVWFVAVLCICLPTLTYALKRSAKVIGTVCIFALILFVFPSIGTSFLNAADLDYDPETKQFTNSTGQTLTVPSFDVGKDEIHIPGEENLTGTDAIGLQAFKQIQEMLTKIKDLDGFKDPDMTVEKFKVKMQEITGHTMGDAEAQALYELAEAAGLFDE